MHQFLSSEKRKYEGQRITPMEGLIIKEATFSDIDTIRELNREIFEEDRVINTFDRRDLLMLIASVHDLPVGFKIGYKHSGHTFYSAKGGVLSSFRRRGIARSLLKDMIARVRKRGYQRFIYDTFPNKHPGMAILGMSEGFMLTKADYNALYKDYRLQFSIDI